MKNIAPFMSIESDNTTFLERRLTTLFGVDSLSMKAYDIVCKEMCVEKGFKRDDGRHYYVHCVDVANTIISFGIKNENAICAALLHDIIEDVEGYTYLTICTLFNKDIADIVLLLTKTDGENYKEEGKLVEYLKGISDNIYASAIKTADRMNNMMTLEEKTFEARKRKAEETEKFYIPFFEYCRKRYPRYENLFYTAITQISPLVFHIKSFYNEIERLEKENEELKKKI